MACLQSSLQAQTISLVMAMMTLPLMMSTLSAPIVKRKRQKRSAELSKERAPIATVSFPRDLAYCRFIMWPCSVSVLQEKRPIW